MQLPSLLFIFYCLPVVIAAYFLLGFSLRLQNAFLLLVSLALYAWGQAYFVFVLLAVIIFNWLIGVLMAGRGGEDRSGSASLLTLGLAVNLAVLVFSQYRGLVCDTVRFFIAQNPGPAASVVDSGLTPGVSIFTLMAVSYLVDIHRRRAEPLASPLDLGLYLSFFPIQAAGPLLHYSDLAAQLRARKTSWAMFSDGLSRLVIGLAKNVILAVTMGDIAGRIFGLSGYAVGESIPSLLALVGLLAFALYIYFYFSSLSDLAIGLGLIFGFRIKENFNYPYAADSLTDFWQRWNISAVSWFKEYFFEPLRKKRLGDAGQETVTSYLYVRDLLVVWIFFGLWHGPKWGLCLWGLFHGIVLLFENIFLPRIKKMPYVLRRIYVLFIAATGWVFFGADTPRRILIYFQNLLGLNNNGFFSDLAVLYLKENLVYFLIALAVSQPLLPLAAGWLKGREGAGLGLASAGLLNLVKPFALLALFLVSIVYLVQLDLRLPSLY